MRAHLCVAVGVIDTTHVTVIIAVLEATIPVYGSPVLAMSMMLFSGFFAQPLTRLLLTRIHHLLKDELIVQLDPVWLGANALLRGLSNRLTATLSLDDPDARLDRQVVEIRDAKIHPRMNFILSHCQPALVERTKRRHFGAAPPVRATKEPT